ncbi:sulfatase-like hydrolase/transferase [Candidatus Bathyarchaeota archaeon]|nr:sulfatase-like hydrolase/transferase [Candidatus Bathyarchaeota archaeon]
MLEELDILKDSCVIITSDHGDELNEHGGLSHDGKMYQELIHIPLLLFETSREKGSIFEAFVSNIDIPPIIVNLFGIKLVKEFAGQNLIPCKSIRRKGMFR